MTIEDTTRSRQSGPEIGVLVSLTELQLEPSPPP